MIQKNILKHVSNSFHTVILFAITNQPHSKYPINKTHLLIHIFLIPKNKSLFRQSITFLNCIPFTAHWCQTIILMNIWLVNRLWRFINFCRMISRFGSSQLRRVFCKVGCNLYDRQGTKAIWWVWLNLVTKQRKRKIPDWCSVQPKKPEGLVMNSILINLKKKQIIIR